MPLPVARLRSCSLTSCEVGCLVRRDVRRDRLNGSRPEGGWTVVGRLCGRWEPRAIGQLWSPVAFGMVLGYDLGGRGALDPPTGTAGDEPNELPRYVTHDHCA
jgi:hypothetical protein